MSSSIEIERIDNDDGGAFVVRNPDTAAHPFLAEMTWSWREGVMVIRHTGVREALQGQGVARRLVMAAVLAARAEGFRIYPVCPYARRVLNGDSAFDDVRAP